MYSFLVSKTSLARFVILTNCRHVRHREGVLCESQQEAGLAHTGVADNDQLQQVVVARFLGARGCSVCGVVVTSELSHLTRKICFKFQNTYNKVN